ncbi:FtsW/RodA/SpoVE family cell cycle protein [candidate division WOR-3 bacterium]|nr:FtsW/RodA/SpoVE family cell cycle protein [candidate division WOR-3 bacterium]MCK4527794.1 FtsW/RodA/SpoVE family cell cycle protein [candidate division WOR-3 bacterium]
MASKRDQRILIVEVLPLFLGALGLIMVFSAASGISVYKRVVPNPFVKQFIIFVLAVTLFFISSKVKPKLWKEFNERLLILTIILLVLTYFFGTTLNYARRWLYIGHISFQPSILAQISLVAFLAKKRSFNISLLMIGLISGLILIQPDISTALITATLGILMLFLNGTDVRKVFLVSFIFLLAGVGYIATQGYAIQRIMVYLNPDSVNYTVKAIATGGWKGLGLGSGMGKFFYIPLADSDFIFSIVGEELGFTGSFLVLGVFLIYFITSAKYTLKASDSYTVVLGLGLISMIFFNALIHILVALGSIPVTGIPLPFISSGGTALLINFIAGGVIVSIAKNGSNNRWGNRRAYISGSLHRR